MCVPDAPQHAKHDPFACVLRVGSTAAIGCETPGVRPPRRHTRCHMRAQLRSAARWRTCRCATRTTRAPALPSSLAPPTGGTHRGRVRSKRLNQRGLVGFTVPKIPFLKRCGFVVDSVTSKTLGRVLRRHGVWVASRRSGVIWCTLVPQRHTPRTPSPHDALSADALLVSVRGLHRPQHAPQNAYRARETATSSPRVRSPAQW